jgi:hypothetical protein
MNSIKVTPTFIGTRVLKVWKVVAEQGKMTGF